ncbi:hypothetical protein ACWIUD_09185 [Helicobacter sp. 23-1044]
MILRIAESSVFFVILSEALVRSEESQILSLPINIPPQTPPAKGGAFSISTTLAGRFRPISLPLPCGGGLRGWVKSQKNRHCEILQSKIVAI